MAKDGYKIAPNPHCKDCWGRGWVTWIVQNGNREEQRDKRVCRCVKLRKVRNY